MKKALFLGAMAVPVATIATASQPSVAQAQVGPPSWSGAYANGTVCGAWGKSSQHDSGVIITTVCTTSCVADGKYNIHGPVAGGGFGYNWQSGQWVTGIETDLSWADVKGHGICALGELCGTKID